MSDTKRLRYYRRDLDIALVWSVDEDGCVVDAEFVWDSDLQLAEPEMLADAAEHAVHLEEVGDMGEPEDGADAERVRDALDRAAKDRAMRDQGKRWREDGR